MSKIIMFNFGLMVFGFSGLNSSNPSGSIPRHGYYSGGGTAADNFFSRPPLPPGAPSSYLTNEVHARLPPFLRSGTSTSCYPGFGTTEIDNGVIREYKNINGRGQWCVLRHPDANVNQSFGSNHLSPSLGVVINKSNSFPTSLVFDPKETFDKPIKKEFIDGSGRGIKITIKKEGDRFHAFAVVKLEPDYKVGNQWLVKEKHFGWDSTEEEYLQLKNGTWKQSFRF